ncbi:MAG: response regulator transcription factor [Lentisphaerae bacterium]|jgi:two-component system alkaline phosphatase synthesis response regulator PhoP|nr:response regulator transcription factor [Lentisphaerota bacterium]
MAAEKILVIEDEEPIRELLKMTLESAGYSGIYMAANGEDGLRLAQSRLPDLILLDLMLPGMDGLSVCRQLKSQEETRAIPIIMLTARSEESDVVIGLELGAVDYITKPFSRKILIARVRAQLRQFSDAEESNEIRRGGLVIRKDQHEVRLNGKVLDLTFSEFAILHLLVSYPGRVYTRNQIITRVKGDGYPVTERAIDVQILNLRRKLGDWAVNIDTVRGVGYRYKQESTE